MGVSSFQQNFLRSNLVSAENGKTFSFGAAKKAKSAKTYSPQRRRERKEKLTTKEGEWRHDFRRTFSYDILRATQFEDV